MIAFFVTHSDESFADRELDALRRLGFSFVVGMHRGITHIHAHFGAATRALLFSRLTGIPFSMTADAHSIFVNRALLRAKVRDAVFVRTTSEFSKRFLENLYPEESRGKVHVVRVGALECGGRASAFKSGSSASALQIAGPTSNKPHKGRAVFLEALTLLDNEIAVGDLPTADIVVQPSVIAPNGQMDGIPVPLIDAMAAGKAVIASAISGIPELVVHDETGLLVDPANPRMLADAIRRLAHDPALRARLGANARAKVARDFCLERSMRELIALLEQSA